MKKLVIIMALAAALVGCDAGNRITYEVANKQKQRCDAIQGKVFYVKPMRNTIVRVDCVVDGATYRMGDY